jgi:hypothetical protein
MEQGTQTGRKGLALELTETETAHLARIDFNPSERSHDANSWPVIADAMEELTRSLLKRGAVPEARRRYIGDAEYNIGGHGSSRQQIIERNGRGTPMLRNPAFLKHLHYFLYGPDLPEDVIESFKRKVRACGKPFTGSDGLEMADHARQLTRSCGLDIHKATNEFYKLALDCGLDAGDARSVRDTVMRTR